MKEKYVIVTKLTSLNKIFMWKFTGNIEKARISEITENENMKKEVLHMYERRTRENHK